MRIASGKFSLRGFGSFVMDTGIGATEARLRPLIDFEVSG
jgi:hypothetical protein